MVDTVPDDRVTCIDVSMPISMAFHTLHHMNVELTKDDWPDSILFCKSKNNFEESNRKK